MTLSLFERHLTHSLAMIIFSFMLTLLWWLTVAAPYAFGYPHLGVLRRREPGIRGYLPNRREALMAYAAFLLFASFLAGIVLISYERDENPRESRWADTHMVLGWIVVALFIIQILLGLFMYLLALVNHWRNPAPRSSPRSAGQREQGRERPTGTYAAGGTDQEGVTQPEQSKAVKGARIAHDVCALLVIAISLGYLIWSGGYIFWSDAGAIPLAIFAGFALAGPFILWLLPKGRNPYEREVRYVHVRDEHGGGGSGGHGSAFQSGQPGPPVTAESEMRMSAAARNEPPPPAAAYQPGFTAPATHHV